MQGWMLEIIKTSNPELLTFIEWMHNEIEANEPTKGFDWRTMNFNDPDQFLFELKKHTGKLEIAMASKNIDRIREHIADDFCYLMFLAVCYNLIPRPQIKIPKYEPK